MTLPGLPDCARLLGQHGASRARRRRIDARRCPAPSGRAAATCMAICLAERRQLAMSAVASSATSTPILPSPGAARCGHRPRPRPDRRSARAARRTLMFSPILATSSVSVCCTLRPPSGLAQQLFASIRRPPSAPAWRRPSTKALNSRCGRRSRSRH